MRKTVMAAALAAVTLTATPAMADPPHWAPAHGKRYKDYDRYEGRYRDGYREYRRGDYYDGYGYRDGYRPRVYRSNGINYWRGDNGRYYCRRSDGTTGMLIGGVAGALLGRSVDRYGDRAPGTIIGAAAGALLGREIDRGGERCN